MATKSKVKSNSTKVAALNPPVIADNMQRLMTYLSNLHSPGVLQLHFQELLLGLPLDMPAVRRENRLKALRLMGYKDYNKRTIDTGDSANQ